MSLLKLLFVNYDISNINSEGFYISHDTKTIKDLNQNEIIYLPFLIDEIDNLYKIELGITKNELHIFVYINYIKLLELVKNYSIIPCRNQLFELLKNNINFFKFNSNLFDKLNKNNFYKTNSNFDNSNLLIKTHSDDIIIYNDLYINLDKKEIKINNCSYRNLIRINSYIIFKPNYEIVSIINKTKKNLIIIDNNTDINTIKLKNKIYINTKNYKKFKLNDIINEKLIILDINLIKKQSYFKKYKKFHSLNNIKHAYTNFKDYINNVNNINNKNLNFFNVELLNFDKIIFINLISETILNNNNFIMFNKLIKTNKKIYFENLFENTYNYNNYKLFRKFIINNNEYHNNIELNNYIIKNNIIISKELLDKKINCLVINQNNQYNQTKFLNINLPKISNIFIFENLFKLNNIVYDFKIILKNKNKNNICPITYDNYNINLHVLLNCNHTFSLLGFINYLYFNNKCPICQKLLNYTKIEIIGTNNIFKKLLLNYINIKDKMNFNYVLVNDKQTGNYLTKRYLTLNILNIEFIKLNEIIKKVLNIKYNYKKISIYYFDIDYPCLLEKTKLNFIINNIFKINNNITLYQIK